jgi:hypothetical protein
MSLQLSPTLGRAIRQDPPTGLGRPTRLLLEEAVRAGQTDEALRWLDYLLEEQRIVRDLNRVWLWYLVRYILDRRGDGDWEPLIRDSLAPWIGTTAGLEGQPAAVSAVAPHAILRVPGAPWDFHVTESDRCYTLTLGPPAVHEQRWAERRGQIEAAIRAGQGDRLRTLLDQHIDEARLVHDIYGDWDWALLTIIARYWGEQILGDVLRATQEPWLAERYRRSRQMSAEEALQLAVEGMRGHLAGPRRTGEVAVSEEADRYVMSFDPCGSGGRMRRGDPAGGGGSRLDPPYRFLNIQGAYPWTWNRKGVCAYCAHCAVALQLVPIETLGHPLRMVEYPQQAGEPCRWIIYKRPELFPAAAYTSVGKVPPDRAEKPIGGKEG